MSYWYGGLYILVEVWQELSVSDAAIDGVVANAANVQLLKRYRNAAFHYQKRYMDDRFMELIQTQDIGGWIRDLHSAFSAFLLRRLSEHQDREADK